jgi:hypothetical protein
MRLAVPNWCVMATRDASLYTLGNGVRSSFSIYYNASHACLCLSDLCLNETLLVYGNTTMNFKRL